MKGYWVCLYEKIAEIEIQKKYVEKATTAIQKYSGKFLVRGGKNISKEGFKSPRTVVVEFLSYDDAVKCYNSNEYKEALSILKNHAKRSLQIIEGA
ncbi:MAG: hypothetical protein CBE47_02145 [Pelagibacteraceae bacterium TMED287]|nr:MAG: hypothetical protein CBE47_02145 [Pelagibacteraceae bacterium TMED287]|tara:strand:+ start:134 stop:421 length:288 start_codon:yes stop_codon:yes gene_type:complete